MPTGVYDRNKPPQRPGAPVDRISTFKSPEEAHIESGVIDPDEVEAKQASIFKRTKSQTFTQWRCLDPDGIESADCPEYEWIGPLGGHPMCPACGSKVALPVEAYEANAEVKRQKMLDERRRGW